MNGRTNDIVDFHNRWEYIIPSVKDSKVRSLIFPSFNVVSGKNQTVEGQDVMP